MNTATANDIPHQLRHRAGFRRRQSGQCGGDGMVSDEPQRIGGAGQSGEVAGCQERGVHGRGCGHGRNRGHRVLANNSLDFKNTDIHSYEYPLLKAKKREALPPEQNMHPAEVCDSITAGGWFWKTNMTEKSVASTKKVVSMLKLCNSRQANYLLNVPPDRTGRIPVWLVRRLEVIGQQLRESENGR